MKLSGITGIPYLITEHMSPFPFKYFKRKDKGLARRILDPYKYSSANIAVSRALQKKMQGHEIPNVRVLYNSVDETLFNLPEVKIPSSPFTIFTLARMIPQKGIDILLRAIKLVQPETDFLFRIGGEGEELKKYKALATELGIDDRVKWLGRLDREQSATEMKKCHAFVLPSRHESMGIVFAEAIACGKPLIGTRCGGPEEIINDHNGLLIPPEDLEALANAIRQLKVQYTQFDVKTIRAGFMNRFSSKVITAQIMEIYTKVKGTV
jgi:glycosyltransferase involved in cell wall biosynthesis